MHDPFLKSVFSDRRMVGVLIRQHVPEWADEIDFATLCEEPNELVAGKTLERRHPDMIWSADTLDGGRVVFLIEFQRTVDPLMALRTTTYAALTLQRIASDEGIGVADRLPEFVYMVLYHGDRPWSAPDRVADLFRRSDPGRYRLVSWVEAAEAGGQSPHDLAVLVLGLARTLSVGDMAAQMAALQRALERHGDADLDASMVERMDTMLESRKYPKELKVGGARTMAEMVDRFQRSLDELVQKGRTQVLRRQAARRFGEETAGRLSKLLEELSDLEGIDKVSDALIECATGEEFIERVRTA